MSANTFVYIYRLPGCDIGKIYTNAFHRANNRVKGTAKPAVITRHDIPKLKKRKDKNDFNSFDAIADLLGARNGNARLEPQKVKISRTGVFAANLIFALF